MQVQKISRVEDLYVFTRTGEVIGSQVWSETVVTSSGSGGYVHSGSGHVQAPSVSSYARTKGRFFLREDDGKESEIRSDFAVRDGHRIIVAYAGNQSNKYGLVMGIHNIVSDNRVILNDIFPQLRGELSPMGCLGIIAGSFFLGLVGSTIFMVLLGTTALALVPIVGIVLSIFFLVRMAARRNRLDSAIQLQLNEALDDALAQDRTRRA